MKLFLKTLFLIRDTGTRKLRSQKRLGCFGLFNNESNIQKISKILYSVFLNSFEEENINGSEIVSRTSEVPEML